MGYKRLTDQEKAQRKAEYRETRANIKYLLSMKPETTRKLMRLKELFPDNYLEVLEFALSKYDEILAAAPAN